ncbi:MAG: type II secretion system protein [Acinetobacter sp.]
MINRTGKHGFTMIELIGAMIIIAILTVAGITAISTAINNSRLTAMTEDLSGFRKVAEQFLAENPQYAKWDGSTDEQDDTQVNQILSDFNSNYLEGEMKHSSMYDVSPYYAVGLTNRLDPWGNPYTICIHTLKFKPNNKNNTQSFIRIAFKSGGENGSTNHDEGRKNPMASTDNNDWYQIVQYSDGTMYSTLFQSSGIDENKDIEYYDYWGFSESKNKWCVLRRSEIPGYPHKEFE